MKTTKRNTEEIHMRLPAEIKKALDDYAEDLTNETGETITISDLVRKSIKDFLKSVDRMPTKKK
jgi:hypothetical protein